MKRKLQVFISSTFLDLEDERQAAVEAVLKAGHIPAGMELFRPGDESQKETIKKWIEESDLYVLILGGRYGSIEKTSGKSYTHWEYDLAGEIGIPRFAIVISDTALDKKIKKHRQSAIEREHVKELNEFRDQVLNKTSHFFDDLKDIKLTILQTLSDQERNDKLTGWVSGKEVSDHRKVAQDILELVQENKKLKEEITRLKMTQQKEKSETKKQISYISPVDFDERVEKIITILGGEAQSKSYPISWYIEEDENNEEEEMQDKEVIVPYPADFTAYFIVDQTDEDSVTYKKLLLVIVGDEDINLQSVLGNIRVIIRDLRNAVGLPIHFVIALPGEHGTLQDKVESFLEKACESEPLREEVNIKIEIWDDNVLEHFEESLGLSVKI